MRAGRFKNALLILLGVALSPVLRARAKRRRRSEGRTILVIPQLTRVGDLVCATPVFRAIKARYPDARLTVLVSKKVVALIRHNPHIDEIVLVEEYGFFALAATLRKERYDWGLSLAGVSTATLLMLFALIPERVKTTRREEPISEKLTDWTANHPIYYEHHTYLPDHYLRMLLPLGITDTNTVPEVFPTTEGERKAGQFLAHQTKPLVGIAITAGNKIKEWGDERFIELARAIHERYEATLVFISGPGDGPRVKNVVAAIGRGDNIVAANFTLDELPALIERLALFIAVDTGPIYIAYARGVPLIDIIGPVDPAEQPPEDERSVRVLPAPGTTPSSFVFKRAGKPEEHARAIASIGVEEVLAAVAKLNERLGLFASR